MVRYLESSKQSPNRTVSLDVFQEAGGGSELSNVEPQ